MKVDINYGSVFKILGWLLLVEAAMLLVPLGVEVIGGEERWVGFSIAAGICVVVGGLLSCFLRYHRLSIGRREGFLLVSLVWVVYSAVGMIPFMMCRHPLGFSDAYFETMSGFTTTGASAIPDVETLSHGVLLWRSMTQWIGGLGIILFMLAVLPALNQKGGIPMFNAETTGITHDKLHPRIRQTAMCLWIVYIGLTVLCIAMLWIGPMDFFDSVCQTFTTVATGGFSTRNEGIAYWHSDYISLVLTGFMFLCGVSFSLIYGVCRGHFRSFFHNDVLRGYVTIVVGIYLAILIDLFIKGMIHNFHDAFVLPMFHVVSAITTTGFGLADYSVWGPFCILLTFMLMFSGGCAGSTSGAIKVDRLVVVKQRIGNEIKKSLYPNRIYSVRVNGNVVNSEELGRVMAFVAIYLGLTLAGGLVLCASGVEITDSFFAVVSCIGNNGLGYGITGPAGGYHYLPDFTKWILSLLMLAGRLELFSVLVMFSPSFWRK